MASMSELKSDLADVKGRIASNNHKLFFSKNLSEADRNALSISTKNLKQQEAILVSAIKSVEFSNSLKDNKDNNEVLVITPKQKKASSSFGSKIKNVVQEPINDAKNMVTSGANAARQILPEVAPVVIAGSLGPVAGVAAAVKTKPDVNKIKSGLKEIPKANSSAIQLVFDATPIGAMQNTRNTGSSQSSKSTEQVIASNQAKIAEAKKNGSASTPFVQSLVKQNDALDALAADNKAKAAKKAKAKADLASTRNIASNAGATPAQKVAAKKAEVAASKATKEAESAKSKLTAALSAGSGVDTSTLAGVLAASGPQSSGSITAKQADSLFDKIPGGVHEVSKVTPNTFVPTGTSAPVYNNILPDYKVHTGADGKQTVLKDNSKDPAYKQAAANSVANYIQQDRMYTQYVADKTSNANMKTSGSYSNLKTWSSQGLENTGTAEYQDKMGFVTTDANGVAAAIPNGILRDAGSVMNHRPNEVITKNPEEVMSNERLATMSSINTDITNHIVDMAYDKEANQVVTKDLGSVNYNPNMVNMSATVSPNGFITETKVNGFDATKLTIAPVAGKSGNAVVDGRNFYMPNGEYDWTAHNQARAAGYDIGEINSISGDVVVDSQHQGQGAKVSGGSAVGSANSLISTPPPSSVSYTPETFVP